MKMNGVAKFIGIGVTVLTLGGTGLWGYAQLDGKVEESAKEIEELEDEHNEDVKDINGKLETIASSIQEQSVTQGKIMTHLEYISQDIKEIKEK